MFAIVVATALANAVTRDTIYTRKLRRRGIDLDVPREHGMMAVITVREALGSPPRPISSDQPLDEIVDRFTRERSDSLPVVDTGGGLLGVVAAVDVEQWLSQNHDGAVVASDLAREAPGLRPDDSLERAIEVLGATDDEGVPVIVDDSELVGWLTHRGLLRAYRTRGAGNGAVVAGSGRLAYTGLTLDPVELSPHAVIDRRRGPGRGETSAEPAHGSDPRARMPARNTPPSR
jgi:chloride channel protein, CIC family